jgi:hypothetical protein
MKPNHVPILIRVIVTFSRFSHLTKKSRIFHQYRSICDSPFKTNGGIFRKRKYIQFGIYTASKPRLPYFGSAMKANVPEKRKDSVYARYHIRHHVKGEYEIDHLIPLELGGSNEITNLWPQSYKTEPWNAHKKDRLENRLKRLVITRHLTLEQAQEVIRTNWIAAYQKYIEEPVNEAKLKYKD